MNTVRTIFIEQSRVVPVLILILLLWMSGTATVQLSNSEDKLVSEEQSSPVDDTDQKTTISNVQEAVIPISKIDILFVYHFLREWVVVEESTSAVSTDTPLPPSRLFLTLFRQIISPNAP